MNTNTVGSLFRWLGLSTIATLAAGAGGCMVSVDAQVPEVSITQKDLTFSGIPAAAAGQVAQLGDVSMSRTFSQKHSPLDLPAGLTPEVKALGVSIAAKQGITDFNFLHYLRVSMSEETDPSHAIELINYQKTGDTGPVLDMPSANPVNVLDQWKTDSAQFSLDVGGTLPEQDWAVDITIRFSGKIDYTH
jgi:hypothetical protein